MKYESYNIQDKVDDDKNQQDGRGASMQALHLPHPVCPLFHSEQLTSRNSTRTSDAARG